MVCVAITVSVSVTVSAAIRERKTPFKSVLICCTIVTMAILANLGLDVDFTVTVA